MIIVLFIIAGLLITLAIDDGFPAFAFAVLGFLFALIISGTSPIIEETLVVQETEITDFIGTELPSNIREELVFVRNLGKLDSVSVIKTEKTGEKENHFWYFPLPNKYNSSEYKIVVRE